jgi:CRISPR/Cas system-associated exonuclease Cas4 (RecB family)
MTEELLACSRTALSMMQRIIEKELFPEPTAIRSRCTDCEYRNFCADVF